MTEQSRIQYNPLVTCSLTCHQTSELASSRASALHHIFDFGYTAVSSSGKLVVKYHGNFHVELEVLNIRLLSQAGP